MSALAWTPMWQIHHIPITDMYADMSFYGITPITPINPRYANLQSPDAMQFWNSVLRLCSESVRIWPADEGGCDVFALGSIIVKSSHLHYSLKIDYTYADVNDIHIIATVKWTLKDIRLPDIYFAGKILNLSRSLKYYCDV